MPNQIWIGKRCSVLPEETMPANLVVAPESGSTTLALNRHQVGCAFRDLEDDRPVSAAPHITFGRQLARNLQRRLATCTMHLGLSLGALKGQHQFKKVSFTV
jgi:hypothetical protein